MDVGLADELLGAVAHKFKAEGLELDGKTRYCALLIDETLLLNFQLTPDGLSLCACLGGLPSGKKRENILVSMMQANCLNAETKGATLGLESSKRVVVLHLLLHLVQSKTRFVQRIEAFIETAKHWLARLNSLEVAFGNNKRLKKRGLNGEKSHEN